MLALRTSLLALSSAGVLSFAVAAGPQSSASLQASLQTDSDARRGGVQLPTALATACGVCRHGDELIGIGPGYSVRFAADGFAFSPALQHSVDPTLRFRMTSVRRASGDRVAAEGTEPTHDARTVRYERPGVVETYHLRPDGVEQSFVFAQRPAGSGELIVRGRLDTALPLVRASTTELLFEQPDRGGVRIGAVTGVDANGVTAAGELRYSDGVLEMTLPAAFVDNAALPFVLDPLIGSRFTPGTFPTGGGSPTVAGRIDVAYDVDTDLYLVVWDNKPTGSSFHNVWSQLVRSDGTLQGALILLFQGFCDAQAPRVTSVRGTGRFFVTVSAARTCGGQQLYSTRVDRNRVSTPIAGGVPVLDSALGGEATTADNEVVLAYVSGGQVFAAEMKPSTGQLVNTARLASSTTNSNVAISRTGGSTGHYLVTWETQVGATTDIRGAIVDRDANVLVSAFPIANTASDDDNPSVDGDGTSWSVAYEQEPFEGSGSNEIYCRGVTYDPATGTAVLAPTATRLPGVPLDDCNPSVAWMGESHLVGLVRLFGGVDTDVWVRSIDAFNCRACEGRFPVARSGQAESHVKVTSQRTAGGTGDDALIVWRSPNGTANATLFRAEDGRVTSLGGSCGRGGTATAACAVVGSPNLGVRVEQAAPLSLAFMLLGFSRLNFPCGKCILIPNFLVAAPTGTDTSGRATITLTVPTDPGGAGLKLLLQWFVVTTPGACGQGSLSNGIEVEIQ